MSERYANNYRVLGIRSGASWKELRKAYKSLINIWHPDRFQQNIDQRKLAEEKTKEITQSYKELAEYYKKFGTLPGVTKTTEKSVVEDVAPQNAQNAHPEPKSQNVEPATTESAPAQEHEIQPSKPGTRILVAVALAGIVFFAWQIMPGDRSDNLSQKKPPAESTVDTSKDEISNQHASASKKYFTFGTPLGKVYAIQGVPTKTEQDIWYYGKSKVYFAKGKVLCWEENTDNPLRVEITPEDGKMEAMFFGEGSSKEQVLAVQGAPDRDAENVWDYGVSRVYFEKNRVKGWDESPFNPLRIKR